jgi:hypothetical protein
MCAAVRTTRPSTSLVAMASPPARTRTPASGAATRGSKLVRVNALALGVDEDEHLAPARLERDLRDAAPEITELDDARRASIDPDDPALGGEGQRLSGGATSTGPHVLHATGETERLERLAAVAPDDAQVELLGLRTRRVERKALGRRCDVAARRFEAEARRVDRAHLVATGWHVFEREPAGARESLRST